MCTTFQRICLARLQRRARQYQGLCCSSLAARSRVITAILLSCPGSVHHQAAHKVRLHSCRKPVPYLCSQRARSSAAKALAASKLESTAPVGRDTRGPGLLILVVTGASSSYSCAPLHVVAKGPLCRSLLCPSAWGSACPPPQIAVATGGSCKRSCLQLALSVLACSGSSACTALSVLTCTAVRSRA